MHLGLMAPFSCRLRLRRLGRPQGHHDTTQGSHVEASNHHGFDSVVSSHPWLSRGVGI